MYEFCPVYDKLKRMRTILVFESTVVCSIFIPPWKKNSSKIKITRLSCPWWVYLNFWPQHYPKQNTRVHMSSCSTGKTYFLSDVLVESDGARQEKRIMAEMNERQGPYAHINYSHSHSSIQSCQLPFTELVGCLQRLAWEETCHLWDGMWCRTRAGSHWTKLKLLQCQTILNISVQYIFGFYLSKIQHWN